MHQSTHFVDRLLTAIEHKGAPVCVGLDPVVSRLPDELRPPANGQEPDVHVQACVEAIGRYVLGVLEAVAPHVPCVKFQSACFERYLWPGVEALHRLMDDARSMGLLVINDAKRGDIGVSAAHYAAGCLGDPQVTDLGKVLGPDALTCNSYLGDDSLEPLLKTCVSEGKGLFALVRTSNPGGDALQGLTLQDGRQVCEAVADLIAQCGSQPEMLGVSGYSVLGAVVGATKPQDAARLRARMPQQMFLVPGFGAQGAGADDVKPCFKADGTGALVTASRSVLYAYEKQPGVDWRTAVRGAAQELKEQIQAILR